MHDYEYCTPKTVSFGLGGFPFLKLRGIAEIRKNFLRQQANSAQFVRTVIRELHKFNTPEP
jgi:hypothetical protein